MIGYMITEMHCSQAELMSLIAQGLTSMGSDAGSFKGKTSLILDVPESHAELVEEAMRSQYLSFRRTDR